ncbi:MAG: hypothetical protein Q9216_004630 [Gyalolechia sp. 2 TL-2023]
MTANVERMSSTVTAPKYSGPRLWPSQGRASTQISLVLIIASVDMHVRQRSHAQALLFKRKSWGNWRSRTSRFQCSTIPHSKHALNRREEVAVRTYTFKVWSTASRSDGQVCWILLEDQQHLQQQRKWKSIQRILVPSPAAGSPATCRAQPLFKGMSKVSGTSNGKGQRRSGKLQG